MDVIACELIDARDKICRRNRELANLPPAPNEPCLGLREASAAGRPLANLSSWTAVAELTLTVDEQATLAPAFAHTDAVSNTLTRAFDWGVKYSTESQRIYTESVTFQVGSLRKRDGRCDLPSTRVSLNGNLGLEEVVELAFGSVDDHDEGVGFSGDLFDGQKKPGTSGKTPIIKSLPFLRRQPRSSGRAGDRRNEGKKEAAFGTSIEFVVTKGISSTGPTWSLAQFKGPGRLFSGERQNTHKLRISFARRGADDAPMRAEIEAKQVNQQLLLEGLAPKLRQAQ